MLVWDNLKREWVAFGQNKCVHRACAIRTAQMRTQYLIMSVTRRETEASPLFRSLSLGMSGHDEWTLCFMIFDVLYVEAEPSCPLPSFVTSANLLMNTYEERREVLRRIVKPQNNSVEIVRTSTST